jgi:acyl-CoA thioesterase-1
MAYHTGLHDRRGFDGPIKGSLAMIVLSLLIMIVYSWKLGLALFLFFGVTFITLESISAPPANRPELFVAWARTQPRRRPVLLCLGDSLTHGNCSASYTPEIPAKLSGALGMDPPAYGTVFANPLWVVNAGQNGITTHTILTERLNKALGCYPDYILLLIGTNDVLSMYSPWYASEIVKANELPEKPSLQVLERNYRGIVNFIRQSSAMVKIAVATLPPLGEDLRSPVNQLVRQANDIIERIAHEQEHCTVLPLFSTLEHILEKNHGRKTSLGMYSLKMALMCPPYHLLGSACSWNMLSSLVGSTILTDGVHLNERGSDALVDLIVEWLIKSHVAKAIAVKS